MDKINKIRKSMDRNIKIFSLMFFAASQGFGGNERTFLDIYQLCK